MPFLSLAMIIKNEASMLPDFFASTRGVFDEMIVVDTGSTDDSVAIATAAGATVVYHEWTNDFATARNVSLRAATGRWVAFFDADERLSELCCRQLRRLATESIFDAYGAATLLMRNRLPHHQLHEVYLLRAFRNDDSIVFKHRIHEDVTESLNQYLENNALKSLRLEGTVEHLGYLTAVAQSQNKKQRDEQMLKDMLVETSHDLYAHFKLLELARYWGDVVLLCDAAAAAMRSLNEMGRTRLSHFHYAHELSVLLALGLHPEKPQEMLSLLTELVSDLSPSPLSQYQIGKCHEELENTAEAEKIYKSCLKLPESREPAFSNVRPLMGLCRLALLNRDLKRAARCVETAFNYTYLDPELCFVTRQLAKEALVQQKAEMVFSIFRPLKEKELLRLQDDLCCAKAAVILGDVQLAIEHLEHAADNPAAGLGLMICYLCLSLDKRVDVNINQDEADSEMRSWLNVVLSSNNGLITQNFLDNSSILQSFFPWLEDALP